MNKSILNDYIDACELIKETELELERLEGKRSTIAMDKVVGSMSEFPYSQTSFKIEGCIDTKHNPEAIMTQELILKERQKKAGQIKLQVERWMNAAPVRMQRIIKYKFFEDLTWGEVALKLGRKATADSVRMEFTNFMKAA